MFASHKNLGVTHLCINYNTNNTSSDKQATEMFVAAAVSLLFCINHCCRWEWQFSLRRLI